MLIAFENSKTELLVLSELEYSDVNLVEDTSI